MIGEASTSYLYSKFAAKEIKKFSPNAKIIIMLRNPVDQMHASHSGTFYIGTETIADFKSALDTEKRRSKESRKNKNLHILLYRDIARYYDQVKRYQDLFGHKNVHIIIFEDFVKNTPEIYNTTLDFLQVTRNYKIDFNKINSNRVKNSSSKPRIWKIQNILFNPPSFFQKIAKNTHLFSKIGYLIYKFLTRINTKYYARTPMSGQLRQKLTKEFERENRKLSKLIKRDLSSWYTA